MKQYVYIALLAVTGFILLILLAFALTCQFSMTSGGAGLRKDDGARLTHLETAQEVRESYENREPLPEGYAASLDRMVMSKLSAGEFEALETVLRDYEETYRENEDNADDEMGRIADYRADLAYYASLTDGAPWQFRCDDVLAAAIAYAPVSLKYSACIDRNSALTVPARDGAALSRADMGNSALKTLLDDINRSRTENGAFSRIAVYDMTLNGRAYQFIAVMDDCVLLWQPYSLRLCDGSETPTAADAYRILRQDAGADLDAIFAAPR